MLHGFINNLTLLVTLLFIGHVVLGNRLVTLQAPLPVRLTFGVGMGAVGAVLLKFSINVSSDVIIDLRYLPISLAAIYGGLLPSIVSGAIISVIRLYHTDISTTSLVAVTGIMTMALGSGLLSYLRWGVYRKWLLMTLLNWSIVYNVLVIVVPDTRLLRETFSSYLLSSTIAALLSVMMMEYLRKSSLLMLQLQKNSSTDHLTGLHNMRNFEARLSTFSQTAEYHQQKLSLIMIDIDHFKVINDTYGHPAGDAVLKQLGDLLSTSSRSQDDVSRYGGEEFAILLPQTSPSLVVEIAERIRKTVQKHRFILPSGQAIHLTISLGVATYPDLTKDTKDLVKKADDALYQAKNKGRNHVCS